MPPLLFGSCAASLNRGRLWHSEHLGLDWHREEGNAIMRAPSQRRARAVRAFVLIEAKPGKALEAAARIAKIPGVLGAWACTGPYDVIAHVEAVDMKSVGRMVANTLQKVPGIDRTITCVAI